MSWFVIQGALLEAKGRRKDYGIAALQETLHHFVEWTTLPDKPFGPHKHDGIEFWYILEGQAVVSIDDEETPVEPGDLVYLPPWSNHGLKTTTLTRWICLG
jgi:mannose-6-phosphate isomerase-like protein (cupin superfamily)